MIRSKMVSLVVIHIMSNYRVRSWNIIYLLRYVDVSDLSVAQHLPLTTHQLFEEVNGGVVIRREKDTYLTCKKVIGLSLTAVLGTKLL